MTKTYKIGYAVVVWLGLLAMSPLTYDAYNLVKLIAMAVGCLMMWIALSGTPLQHTLLDAPLAALWFAMVVSTIRSVSVPTSVFGQYPQEFYGLLPLSVCLAIYYAVAQVVADDDKDAVLRVLLRAAVPFTVYGVIQRFVSDRGWMLFPPLFSNRIMSTMGSPVMFGACLVPLSVIAMHWTLEKRDEWEGRVCATLIAVALIMTWSRGAWISTALALAVYAWLTGRVLLNKERLVLLCMAMAVAVPALHRVLGKVGSDGMRIELVKTSASAFFARPVLGFGPDTFALLPRGYWSPEALRLSHDAPTIAFNAHNDVLQIAATLGLFGLLAYVCLVITMYKHFVGVVRISPRDACALAGISGVFLQAKVNPILPPCTMIIAVLAGLTYGGGRSLSPGASRVVALAASLFCGCAALLLMCFYCADLHI